MFFILAKCSFKYRKHCVTIIKKKKKKASLWNCFGQVWLRSVSLTFPASEVREAGEHGEPAGQQQQRPVLRLHAVWDHHRQQRGDPQLHQQRQRQSAGEDRKAGVSVKPWLAHTQEVTNKLHTSCCAAAVRVDRADKCVILIFLYIFPFFSPPPQVFVDRQFVGVLDYETKDLALPNGTVTWLCILPSCKMIDMRVRSDIKPSNKW